MRKPIKNIVHSSFYNSLTLGKLERDKFQKKTIIWKNNKRTAGKSRERKKKWVRWYWVCIFHKKTFGIQETVASQPLGNRGSRVTLLGDSHKRPCIKSREVISCYEWGVGNTDRCLTWPGGMCGEGRQPATEVEGPGAMPSESWVSQVWSPPGTRMGCGERGLLLYNEERGPWLQRNGTWCHEPWRLKCW